jgi:hypothetical protein
MRFWFNTPSNETVISKEISKEFIALKIALLAAQDNYASQVCGDLKKHYSQASQSSQIEKLSIDDIFNFDATVFDTVLLLGIVRHPTDAEMHADSLIRNALIERGINFQVVYDSGAAQLQNPQQHQPQRLRHWDCERCSDPVCEHRLFRDLLNKS